MFDTYIGRNKYAVTEPSSEVVKYQSPASANEKHENV